MIHRDTITAKYPGTCLTCEEPFKAGDAVCWETGVGCWHAECAKPKNLAAAKKTVARRKVLEPEFGQFANPFQQDR